MLSLGGIYILLKKSSNPLTAVLFCLLAALFLMYLKPSIWLNDWNPFVIIFPVLLTFISFAAVAAGFHRYLPIAVIAGSFSVQTHIGCFPSVAAAAVFAAVFMIIHTRSDSRKGASQHKIGSLKKSIAVASASAVILWAPVLLQEAVSGSGGNLHRILQFLREVSPELSFKKSLVIWIDAVSGMDGNLLSGEHLRRMGILIHVKGIIVFIRVVLLFLSCIYLYRKKRSSFIIIIGEMALLLHFSTFVSVLQLRGEPHGYLLIWFASLGLLSWTVIIASMFSIFTVLKRDGLQRIIIQVFTGLIMILSLLITVSIWNAQNHGDPLSYHNGQVEAISDSLCNYLYSQDEASWIIVPGKHELWPLMTGLVNRLDKEGWSVAVAADFTFMTELQPDEGAVPLYLIPDSSSINSNRKILFSYENILVCR